jgi:putative CocE/NonD family hydrolase
MRTIPTETVSRASEIFGRRMRLPRPQTYDVVCEQDLRATMDDGVTLLADRWVARDARDRGQPTVLVRSPYGRRQFVGLLFGRLLAERGLQVVIQSVRGTFGSGGEFNPFFEREDGLATLRWLREQPWHAGPIGMMGPSYLGLVQWAVAPEAGDDLAALAIQVSASQFHGQTYAGGSISLESAASWLVIIAEQERRAAPLAMMRALRGLRPLLSELPLGTLDERVAGAPVSWFREGLSTPDASAPYWSSRNYTAGIANVTAAVQMITGWQDILLPWMLEDHAALQAAGRNVQLVIGPWTHTAPGLAAAGDRLGLGWLRWHLLGDARLVRSEKVRVFVTGEPAGGGWRALPAWPPPDTGSQRWFLGPAARLSPDPAGAAGSDRYVYDPNQPTPSVGGPVLLEPNAVVDNRRLEARPDVLTFTTGPLPETVEAIGPVRVELSVRASRPYFDLFARVCEVEESGASWNVTDALARVAPGRFDADRSGDGVHRVEFDLWPIGHRFAAGHRIRLQVSSGAHPRYARNPGTGEEPLTATRLEPVEIELLHGGAHPSAVILPA